MPIRVLVVEDSALMRRLIVRMLEEDSEIKVIDTAANGEEAIKKAQALKPDVITLDVEMPVLDGLSTLDRLMGSSPFPVVMLNAHTTEGARATLQALALGAVDFVSKPTKPADIGTMNADLKYKVRAAAQASLGKVPLTMSRKRLLKSKQAVEGSQQAPVAAVAGRPEGGGIDLVVIGSSTGGPAALQSVIPRLPGNLPAGVVVVQHIPAGFSGPLAEHLDRKSILKVKHAEQGEAVTPGKVLVAPAGFDLTFKSGPVSVTVDINPGQKPLPPGGFRPSIDMVMKSAAKTFKKRVMGVLLTGMGRDGAQGMLSIRNEEGPTVAEAESTCVIFGMPRAAIEIGGAGKIVPLDKIANEIVQRV